LHQRYERSDPFSAAPTLHRGLVDRALTQQHKVHKVKFLFKKLLSVETRIGDADGQERAKGKAREWVAKNAQSQQ
jgi:rRNA biogenesis protein RRP5